MRVIRYFIATFLLPLFVACATQNQQSEAPVKNSNTSAKARHKNEKVYTKRESAQLSYCAALTDTAYTVALVKFQGKPKELLKTLYKNNPNSNTILALIDKVYKEESNHVWQYSLDFFNDCAINVAGISKDRLKFADYCNQNHMVAGVAYLFKSKKKSKDKAYDYFAKYNSKTVNGIIDNVYNANGDRAEITMGIWNNCIGKLTIK